MKYLLALAVFLMTLSCATPQTSEYSTVKYKAGACFGTCPMFTISINPDRSAVIDAEHYTFTKNPKAGEISQEKEGTFRATITPADYQKLITLLNGLNVKTLNDNYGSRNVTDLPTGYLTVNYKDGTVKTIEDYGKAGTPKLKELYNFLEGLRFSQSWTKVQ